MKIYFPSIDKNKKNFDYIGQFARYGWDKWITYKGNCVFNNSGIGGLEGILMNF